MSVLTARVPQDSAGLLELAAVSGLALVSNPPCKRAWDGHLPFPLFDTAVQLLPGWENWREQDGAFLSGPSQPCARSGRERVAELLILTTQ